MTVTSALWHCLYQASCESAWLKKPPCVGPAVPYEYKYTTSRQRQIPYNTGLLYMHTILRANAVIAVSVLHSSVELPENRKCVDQINLFTSPKNTRFDTGILDFVK